MHFVLPIPSLQHLAGVKIVSHFWTQPDVFTPNSLDPILVDLYEDSPEWLTIIELVKKKVLDLALPQRCTEPLRNLVTPLGTKIFSYCMYYREEVIRETIQLLDILLPNHLRWTMHGTIDYKRTAESMVKDESVHEQKRFECLEDEARELYPRVAEDGEQEYVLVWIYAWNDELCQLILSFARSINLDVRDESLWLADESRWFTETYTNEQLFQVTLSSGNRAMLEYLFTNLSQREKERVFRECRRLIRSCHLFPICNLLYYLSLMNEEQQEDMFDECSLCLLRCLSKWPAQSLFMDAWNCGCEVMDNDRYTKVLSGVIDEMEDGFRDYDYCQLFWKCWELTPAEVKLQFLDNLTTLNRLLLTKRAEFIQLVLNEARSHQILALCIRYDEISPALMDESAISDAALMECKEKAAMESSNDEEDEEKRLRSQYVCRLVDVVMESRMERRERPN